MKRLLILASFLSSGAFANTDQEELALKAKFSQALSVVLDSTNQVTAQATLQGAPSYPKYDSAPTMLAEYGSGKVTQQITVTVNSPAAQILSEVSQIVYEMGTSLYEGVQQPTPYLQEKVCGIVFRGFEKRRHAPFYEGYNSLHFVFQRYVDQFVSVSYILECPSPL